MLLVGDAAGLVDPLTGDGMYEAFVSGKLAAEAILAGDLAAYEPRVLAELGPLHGASWSAKHALDRFPRLTFGIARLPFAWPVIARIVRGDLKDPGEGARRLARAAQGARPARQARGAGTRVGRNYPSPNAITDV